MKSKKIRKKAIHSGRYLFKTCVKWIPPYRKSVSRAKICTKVAGKFGRTSKTVKLQFNKESQRKAVLSALEKADGNKTKAAKMLGLYRSALYKIMSRLSIDGEKGSHR